MTTPANILGQAAAKWLGWDSFAGVSLAHPCGLAIDQQKIESITNHPRHYGFHGTLKAPFRLSDGFSEADILSVFEDFGKHQKMPKTPIFEVNKLDGFYALTAKSAVSELNALANSAMRHFERFRAPITNSDYEKRKPHLLSDRQRSYLVEWGYPFVFEEFHFHMTLSDRVDDDDALIGQALKQHFTPNLLAANHSFGIGLCVEADKQPFQVLAFAPLTNFGIEENRNVS